MSLLVQNNAGMNYLIRGYKYIKSLFADEPLESPAAKRMKAYNLITKNIFGPTFVHPQTQIEWPHFITCPFGPRTVKKLDGEKTTFHYGIDLVPRNSQTCYAVSSVGKRADLNYKIKAIGDGVVVEAGFKYNGMGYYVVLKHANGIHTVYGHLQRVPSVKQGDKVHKGDTLGYFGRSGKKERTTGEHLHFEIRKNADQLSAFNPAEEEGYQCIADLTANTSFIAANERHYFDYAYLKKSLNVLGNLN